MASALSWISKQDARHRLFVSLGAAGVVWFGLRDHVKISTQSIATWDVFALCVLALSWLTISTTPASKLRARAREQDVSRTVIFVFVIVAACAGLFAVGFLFYNNKGSQAQPHFTLHLLLSLFAVVASWCLVHTVFGLRYAHKFYGDGDDPARDSHAGGLEFPGEPAPNYMDFAYFSFVIGMTFQVSDVQITSRDFRQLALLHGMLSFAFNTVILALTINTVSSLL